MTAISALSANKTPSTATSPAATAARTVLLPGSPATYANRAALRAIGLRWDPVGHRWHGTTTVERVRELRERLGLVVKCFGDLETPPKGPSAPQPGPTRPEPALSVAAVSDRGREQRAHDGARTRLEARLAIPRLDADDEESEIPTATRRFSLREITSGLPDDSREEEERREERQLRDLRGRVKAARAVVASTPGLTETLARDWKRAARFFVRYGITEGMFRLGVPSSSGR